MAAAEPSPKSIVETRPGVAEPEVQFDPAIVRRVELMGEDGSVTVYRQPAATVVANPHHSGSHELRVSGGPSEHDVALEFRDPQLRLSQATIYLANDVVFPGGDHVHRHATHALVVLCGAETVPPLLGASNGEAGALVVQSDPAIVRRCVLAGESGELELYRQKAPFKLLNRPHPASHDIRLSGGPSGYDLGLRVHDPKFQITALSLEIAAPPLPGLDPTRAGGSETLQVEFGAETCPPICADPLYDEF